MKGRAVAAARARRIYASERPLPALTHESRYRRPRAQRYNGWAPRLDTIWWYLRAVVGAQQHSQWHGGTLSRAPSRVASLKSRRSSCAIRGLIAQLKGSAGGGGSPARADVHRYRQTYFFGFCVKSLFFSMQSYRYLAQTRHSAVPATLGQHDAHVACAMETSRPATEVRCAPTVRKSQAPRRGSPQRFRRPFCLSQPASSARSAVDDLMAARATLLHRGGHLFRRLWVLADPD